MYDFEQLEENLLNELIATNDHHRANRIISQAGNGGNIAIHALNAAKRYREIRIQSQQSALNQRKTLECPVSHTKRDNNQFKAGYDKQVAAIMLAIRPEQRKLYGQFIWGMLKGKSGHYVAGERQALRELCNIEDNKMSVRHVKSR